MKIEDLISLAALGGVGYLIYKIVTKPPPVERPRPEVEPPIIIAPERRLPPIVVRMDKLVFHIEPPYTTSVIHLLQQIGLPFFQPAPRQEMPERPEEVIGPPDAILV